MREKMFVNWEIKPPRPKTEGNLQQRQPQTLTEDLQGVNLTADETRAVIAADALRYSLAAKRILFANYVFFTAPSGVFRVNEIMEYTTTQTVHARDIVKTIPIYETLWQRHQALMEPNVAEVAIYKRVKKTHVQIAEILHLDESDVDKISLRLANLGILSHSTQAERFALFCRQVELADAQPENSQLTAKQLAVKLRSLGITADEQRVTRARERNRLQAKPSSPGNAGKKTEALKIITAILAHPERNDAEIALELGKRPRQVKWQRGLLLSASAIQRKTTLYSSKIGNHELPSRREEVKQSLRPILDDALARRNPVVLAHLYRDNASLQKVSITILRELYREHEREHDVPPLLHNR